MNTKYIAILATLSLIMTGCSANSKTALNEDYFPAWYNEISMDREIAVEYEDEVYSCYEFSDHTVITQYKGNENIIEIPSYINNKPVTKIGADAFKNCKAEKVIIPETVTSLGIFAFAEAEFKTVTIPENVKYINDGCFKYSALEEVHIENPHIKIASDAFAFTPFIKNTGDPLIINNILIKHSTAEGKIMIPDGIVNIADGAFEDNTQITDVVIPESVTSIGYGAFARCSSLRNVVINGEIKNVGNAIFLNTPFADESTEPIIINNTLIHYPKSASGKISLSKDIVKVGGLAFYGCNNITALNIPDEVDVDSLAVMGCANLIEVNGISIEEYKFLLI